MISLSNVLMPSAKFWNRPIIPTWVPRLSMMRPSVFLSCQMTVRPTRNAPTKNITQVSTMARKFTGPGSFAQLPMPWISFMPVTPKSQVKTSPIHCERSCINENNVVAAMWITCPSRRGTCPRNP